MDRPTDVFSYGLPLRESFPLVRTFGSFFRHEKDKFKLVGGLNRLRLNDCCMAKKWRFCFFLSNSAAFFVHIFKLNWHTTPKKKRAKKRKSGASRNGICLSVRRSVNGFSMPKIRSTFHLFIYQGRRLLFKKAIEPTTGKLD